MDGNGRTSRLLSTLCLYRAGYDFKRLFTLSEYYDRDRSAFYRAIQSVRERDMDLTGWLEYFVGGLATQLEEVKARGTNAIQIDIIARDHKLNHRQSEVLAEALSVGRVALEEPRAALPRGQPADAATRSQVVTRQGVTERDRDGANRSKSPLRPGDAVTGCDAEL